MPPARSAPSSGCSTSTSPSTPRAASASRRWSRARTASASHVTQCGEISRDLADLAGQALSRNHQYPDGFVLFIGTMFTPLDDRGAPGSGFTHKVGDMVSISSPDLGTLVNEVVTCDQAEPWTFGTGALMANLARRNLLKP